MFMFLGQNRPFSPRSTSFENLEERELNIAQSHSPSVPVGRKYESVLMWSLLCTFLVVGSP